MIRIGKYEIYVLETGRFRLDGGGMFGIVPKVIWNRFYQSDEKNRIELAMKVLLIVGSGRKIVVDTGVGTKLDRKAMEIFAVDFSRYSLQSSLAELGLTEDDITDVVLTHLHFDHAGGATTLDEDQKIRPAFRNAIYYVQRRNFEYAMNPIERDKASYMRENFVPLFESGQLRLLEGEGELFDGIETIVSDGHTFGQQLIRISDGETTLLHCGDLIPTSSHIPIPYVMAYDLQPLVTMEEKRKILEKAVYENWILFFEHDPHTDCATVKRDEKQIKADRKFKI